MKTFSASTASALAGALALLFAASGAHAAQDAGTTRAQVRAELADAKRDGDVLAAGERGITLRELNPQRYAQQAVSAKSRAQVVAELSAARRDGDLLASGDAAQTQRERHPERYAAAVQDAGKSRAQVRTELAEALRNGDVITAGESGRTLADLRRS